MTLDLDRTSIEARIAHLVRATVGPQDGQGTIVASCRTVLDEVTRQALTSSEGGKRLRALLLLDAFDATAPNVGPAGFGGNGDAADVRDHVLDLACAIEVFQTAALVHDDIIDDSDLRRGKPSAHRALAAATHSDPIGNGLGIMLGDLLATASVDIANAAARHLPSSDAVVAAFLNMHREVEIGQVLDLAVEMTPLDDPRALAEASLNVFRWKTASYTTIAPMELALIAAGVSPADARGKALAVGKPLGLAFQLADDLLDVIGSSKNTGKPVGGDIREGKRTVLLADALEAASTSDREELVHLFEASHRDDDQVRHVIELFGSTGAVDRSKERIGELWRQSRTAIEQLELPDDATTTLAEACARFVPLD
ncbi:polyprenyl synthetase family protein [Bifidobacterium simiiventris]|uniref:polyprenyl synthetase family protein n=1 Tax=Bifidobacterium simiiventris TaxID=2834434 RepID=UPI001C596B84|nr:polyprenyl synthetase family protein [Bifidobacterium simiiventris]MBW3078823.1 polyprenyl synthetase family protein [Bifidobacterium simiiventris]